MKNLILFLLVALLVLSSGYNFVADMAQEIIASNNGASWAPTAQKIFAETSYYLCKHRVTREAYAMQLKLFPKQADTGKAIFRIAKASERMSDYRIAAKFYRKFLNQFPDHLWATEVRARLADIESVYLELLKE